MATEDQTEADQITSDAAALAAHITELEAKLAAAEAKIAAAPAPPAAPAAPETSVPVTTPPPVEAVPVPLPPEIAAKAPDTPGGLPALEAEHAEKQAAAAQAAAQAPAPVPAEPSSTPVLDVIKAVDAATSGAGGFIGTIRKAAEQLVAEGKLLEADLLSPGEAQAVNATAINLIGELIKKAGL